MCRGREEKAKAVVGGRKAQSRRAQADPAWGDAGAVRQAQAGRFAGDATRLAVRHLPRPSRGGQGDRQGQRGRVNMKLVKRLFARHFKEIRAALKEDLEGWSEIPSGPFTTDPILEPRLEFLSRCP